ncbi:MAG: NAD(P)/FAD-dependent oxidoreductase [Candidatus Aenigmarchaeota archaeon]|nr:NAD(P)/FAD-dependent oxidoreductase [Candidatus Aenigmarchaeota archaeon]MDI6722577.1 NAD(P)/FAD-dependent oxidoreductase [Candidatus Aenigmarchaeota archaeon]
MYDIIIIGSGVAGSTIARYLDGFNVLILEKNKKVVPKDSGIVSKRFFEFYDRKFAEHEISEMELVAPNGSSFFLTDDKPFAYALHREKFAHAIIKDARKCGELRHETFLSMAIGKECVSVATNKGDYEARMVAGCDGALSRVRKCIGIKDMKLSVGIMTRKSGIKNGNIKVFFNKNYSPDFFSWIIPQTDEYGLMAGSRSRECLDKFKSDQRLSDGKLYAYMIPTGMTRSYSDRCILAGDACGQNKPLTGGGIIFSLIGAKHAARTINESLHRGRFDCRFLSQYEKAWRKEISFEIRKQLLVRKVYSKINNEDINRIFRDFGSHIQNLRGFDYDKFSKSWKHLPKIKLARFAIGNLHHLFQPEFFHIDFFAKVDERQSANKTPKPE